MEGFLGGVGRRGGREGRKERGKIYLSNTITDTLDSVSGCFTDVSNGLSDGVCYAADGVLETTCETCGVEG